MQGTCHALAGRSGLLLGTSWVLGGGGLPSAEAAAGCVERRVSVSFSGPGGAELCRCPPYATRCSPPSFQVPSEPMYIILKVESSTLPLDAALALPAQMEVDWVRLYQSPRHSVGCDPAARPTAEYIAAHPDLYRVRNCSNGVCEAGECDQCPRDCRNAATCRQDCRVPVCQVSKPGAGLLCFRTHLVPTDGAYAGQASTVNRQWFTADGHGPSFVGCAPTGVSQPQVANCPQAVGDRPTDR